MCLMLGGPTYLLPAADKVHLFEVHPYCGPTPVGKRGDPLASNPTKRFWDAYERWDLGGRQIADDGKTCVVPEWCGFCGGSGYDEIERVGNQVVIEECPKCDGQKLSASH